MAVMSPRIGLIKTTDGWPTLAQSATITVQGHTMTVPVWETSMPCQLGPYPAVEYRYESLGRLFVVCKIADVTAPDGDPACLSVCFVPASGVDQGNTTWSIVSTGETFAPLILVQYECAVDTDGALIVPALDADTSDLAMLCKSVWPAQWHKYLPTDDPGEMGVRPAAPPTGQRIVGVALAW